MRKKNSIGKFISIFVVTLAIVAVGFVYLSPQFEKNPPKITFDEDIYWNLKDPLPLKIEDDTGIKYYKVTYNDGKKSTVLENQVLSIPSTSVDLEVKPPKLDMFYKGKEVSVTVEAVDNSKWNFLDGNMIKKEFTVLIDKKRPTANVIGNSFAIRKGGSAVVVVEVRDENLKDAYISFNDEERFELIPFYREGFFATLIAWPVTIESFQRVNLIAIDKANNVTKTKVPLYIRKLKVNNDNIKLSDSFIQNISANVLEVSGMNIPEEVVDIFVKTNKELRAKNVQKIKDISRKFMDKDQISNFNIRTFRRLRGSKTVAGYADRRHYYHNGEKIDEAWHLGMDWASIKKAPVKSSNSGKVIFSEYLGIYGNSVIIDHKLGLQSLYSHLTSIDVALGDEIGRNKKIGNTGSTGAVFGDHLHFGILVQGIEVNPLEWMDRNWIKTRITNILKESKRVIDNK